MIRNHIICMHLFSHSCNVNSNASYIPSVCAVVCRNEHATGSTVAPRLYVTKLIRPGVPSVWVSLSRRHIHPWHDQLPVTAEADAPVRLAARAAPTDDHPTMGSAPRAASGSSDARCYHLGRQGITPRKSSLCTQAKDTTSAADRWWKRSHSRRRAAVPHLASGWDAAHRDDCSSAPAQSS